VTVRREGTQAFQSPALGEVLENKQQSFRVVTTLLILISWETPRPHSTKMLIVCRPTFGVVYYNKS
jgi:hypothetical protein